MRGATVSYSSIVMVYHTKTAASHWQNNDENESGWFVYFRRCGVVARFGAARRR